MTNLVFLSHSSRDAAFAQKVCSHLEGRGLSCWIAPRNIAPGERWGAALVDAIARASAMVVLVSSASNASHQVAREVERAVSRCVPLLPFLLEEVELSRELEFFLSSEQWLESGSGGPERQLPKLHEALLRLIGGVRLAQSEESTADREEAIRAFEEIAPDEWRVRPGSWLSRWLHGIFVDRS